MASSKSAVQCGEHGRGRRDRRVHLGSHPCLARPVCAADGRESASQARIRHRRKRNLVSRRCPHVHRIEGLQQAALPFRVAHHDANVVCAALDAERFFAVERLPDLVAEVAKGNAQGFAGARHREPEFGLAGVERVGDVVDARKGLECPAHRIGNRTEVLPGVPGQADVDFRLAGDAVREEREFDRVGDGACGIAPEGRDRIRRHGALFARRQLHGDFAEMGTCAVGYEADAGAGREVAAPALQDVQNDGFAVLLGKHAEPCVAPRRQADRRPFRRRPRWHPRASSTGR